MPALSLLVVMQNSSSTAVAVPVTGNSFTTSTLALAGWVMLSSPSMP